MLSESLRSSSTRRRPLRGGRRRGKQLEKDRIELQRQIEKEIDALVADMHAQLPRNQASEIGIVYARYSTDFQHSIGDLIRTIFEDAVKKKIFIPREYVFFDTAVRGCKERRPGLDPVRELLRRKAAQVLA